MSKKNEMVFCVMSGCDFEASEERESPITGETMDLCYSCSEAYDMGVEHGMVAAEQLAKGV